MSRLKPICWDDVAAELERRRPLLARTGAVCVRRRTGGVLHYAVRIREQLPDGRRIQRAIRLGTDAELAERVRRLLGEWQAPHDPARSRDPILKEIWCAIRQAGRLMPRQTALAFRKHLRAAGTDVRDVLEVAWTWPAIQQQREQGRCDADPPRPSVVSSLVAFDAAVARRRSSTGTRKRPRRRKASQKHAAILLPGAEGLGAAETTLMGLRQ